MREICTSLDSAVGPLTESTHVRSPRALRPRVHRDTPATPAEPTPSEPTPAEPTPAAPSSPSAPPFPGHFSRTIRTIRAISTPRASRAIRASRTAGALVRAADSTAAAGILVASSDPDASHGATRSRRPELRPAQRGRLVTRALLWGTTRLRNPGIHQLVGTDAVVRIALRIGPDAGRRTARGRSSVTTPYAPGQIPQRRKGGWMGILSIVLGGLALLVC